MSSSFPRYAPRGLFILSAAVLILVSGWSAIRASEITATKDFMEVVAAAMEMANRFGPEHVLVVLDIDNTLLAMNGDLGSDQWFEWQRSLIETDPNSRLAVAKTFQGLLQAQGVLFNLNKMHPPQDDLPALVARLQNRGIYTLVITSRGDEFRPATESELRRNDYDFSLSALPVRNIPHGTYEPYDLNDLAASGLTEKELAAFKLGEPRPVSYAGGILMTAGQPKGAMLLALLHHSIADIQCVVYADDNARHVGYMFAAIAGRGREISASHYRREDCNVQRFQEGDKEEVAEGWQRLHSALEEVFAE